jgi:hypothetical protein
MEFGIVDDRRILECCVEEVSRFVMWMCDLTRKIGFQTPTPPASSSVRRPSFLFLQLEGITHHTYVVPR